MAPDDKARSSEALLALAQEVLITRVTWDKSIE
jgi:hypothetical protein